jgi:hypothetical protein
MKGKVDAIPWDKLSNLAAYAGLDLSTTDLSAYVILSEPDELGERYAKFYLSKDTHRKRSKEDRVPYQYWADILTSSPHQET